MITLKKEGVTMEVATEFEASVFLRSGYKRVDEVDKPVVKADPVIVNAAQEEKPEAAEKAVAETDKPKRRRRTAKQAG